MVYGPPTHNWIRGRPKNNGSSNKNNAVVETVQQPEPPEYGDLSKIELAAIGVVHNYDPTAKGHGPNGPLFDDILNSLVPSVANIGRRELHDILTGLIDAKYISIDPINLTYSLTDRGKNLL